eukprot:1874505-Pyramimonas_sp.AAC.1
MLFKTLRVSLVYSVLQLRPPSPELVKVHRSSVRLVSAGPNNALPYDARASLTRDCLPVGFPRPERVATAARPRYIARCDDFPSAQAIVDCALQDDDWRVARAVAGWHPRNFPTCSCTYQASLRES